MTNTLSPQEVDVKLKKLALEWSVISGTSLVRDYTFDDFDTALQFVNKVGAVAAKEAHHPDILLKWGKVHIELTTHEVSSLTAKDFKLAMLIESEYK